MPTHLNPFGFLMCCVVGALLVRAFIEWAVRRQFENDRRRRQHHWQDDSLTTQQRIAELQRRADFEQESG